MTELSPALVRRLPAYFRALIKLYGSGKERTSSEELACELALVPSQVRTDLNALGCVGQRGYGYGIPTLYKKIADILQLSDKFSAVTVGSGNIIKAVASTEVFTKRGIKLAASFTEGDDSECFSSPVCREYSFSDFTSYLDAEMPSIVLLGCSETVANEIFTYLENRAKSGFIAPEIWNFTDLDLASDLLTVKNIHLCDYVMLLCHEVGKSRREQK